MEYIKDHGIGGAMWWESSGDKAGEESLINTVYVGMKNCDGRGIERSDNQLEYPESKFENLKKGFPGED
jgi:chitinase